MYINEERLFNLFLTEKRTITYEELCKIFNDSDGQEILDEANSLERDNLIQLDGFGWVITPDGEQKHKESIAQKEAELELAKIEFNKLTLEVKQLQSIIDTNESVKRTNDFTIQNTKKQNLITISSLIVAGTSALFAFGAMYATLKDTTDEELRLLRQQFQKQLQSQEQMQQSQRGIDSSMKIYLERSFNKDTSIPNSTR